MASCNLQSISAFLFQVDSALLSTFEKAFLFNFYVYNFLLDRIAMEDISEEEFLNRVAQRFPGKF